MYKLIEEVVDFIHNLNLIFAYRTCPGAVGGVGVGILNVFCNTVEAPPACLLVILCHHIGIILVAGVISSKGV